MLSLMHPHQLCWLHVLLVLAIYIISNHGEDAKLSRSRIADWVADITVIIRIMAQFVSVHPNLQMSMSGALIHVTFSCAHV